MTDRELLELAANAAGVELRWPNTDDIDQISPRKMPDWDSWNPLTDDGDALRLAVKLRIDIQWQPIYDSTTDEQEMTLIRYAIVRAAAEIGKGMK